MKIHFLGGSDEVGASCILVELGGQRILIDAGIRVSPKARDGLSGELLPDLSPLNTGKLDAVIITHAHADHIGAIPLVLGSLPKVPVYATPATLSLMSVMFRDALHIMDTRMEIDGEMPSYDILQVQHVEEAARPTDWKQEFSINGAVNVTFYRAGHIPGAVSVFLQADNGSILISGDLSFSPMRATPEAEIPPVSPDALILETTYGGRFHANRRAEEQRLIDAVSEIVEQGGRVLIPAFALGRAQEVALILDYAIARKKMPAVPVYLDGMTRAITRVFERFPDYLSKGLQKHLDENFYLFRTENLHFVESRKHREDLAVSNDPMVIIASSGMLTGGASPFYAQHLISDPRSAIFITGYQDEESPGRILQSLAAQETNSIKLVGRRFEVKCKIDTYGLSAHADENELTQFAVQLAPRRVFLVHGDGYARERMRDLLHQRRLNVTLPNLGEAIEMEGSNILGRRKEVSAIPHYSISPITSVEDLDLNLPLHNTQGDLYIRHAKKAAEQLFPPATGLRKMKFIKEEQIVRLTFDFPRPAATQYAEEIAQIKEDTGWEVVIKDSVNMNALQTAAQEVLGTYLIGRVSIHLAEEYVEAKLRMPPEDWEERQKEYENKTGFRLVEKVSGSNIAPQPSVVPTLGVATAATASQMEINAAYAVARQVLAPLGMYKVGLKTGTLVLNFITPEQGIRHLETISRVSEQVGYPMTIHPHPNQAAIIELLTNLCNQLEVYLVKNPSLMIAEKTVAIESADPLSDEIVEALTNEFHAMTAWGLQIKQ